MKYLVPIYSRTLSEADIQSEVYHRIKSLGLEPRLEVRGYLHDDNSKNHRRKCRFDIVVFWPLNHKPLCIVECKKGSTVSKGNLQRKKYEQFGLPLVYCFKHNMDAVTEMVRSLALKNWHDAPPSLKLGYRTFNETDIRFNL